MSPLSHRLLTAALAAVIVTGGIVLGMTATRSGSSGSHGAAGVAGPPDHRWGTIPDAHGTRAGGLPVDLGPGARPIRASFSPVSVTFVSANLGWVLGSTPCPAAVCTAIARTSNGGSSWGTIPAPVAPLAAAGGTSGAGVSQLLFADPENGWAYGPALYATHDGGRTWQRQALPPGASAVTSMAATGGTVFAVATTDDGAGDGLLLAAPAAASTWDTVTTFPPDTAAELSAAGGRVWVFGSGVLMVVPAGPGKALTPRDPCAPPAGAAALAAWGTTEVTVVCAGGGAAGSQGKTAFQSGDGGRRFAVMAGSPPAQGEVEAVATNGRTVMVGASSGTTEIYASFDGGRTWVSSYSDNTGGAPVSDLSFVTGDQAVAIEGVAGTGPQPFLIMTTDGGHRWYPVPIVG